MQRSRFEFTVFARPANRADCELPRPSGSLRCAVHEKQRGRGLGMEFVYVWMAA